MTRQTRQRPHFVERSLILFTSKQQFDKVLPMFKWLQSGILSTGLAMFSMFFGAGNIVFPLALGQYAQDSSPYAIAGLLISAVLVPFIGVTTMTLFRGDYMAFFGRIGRIPGFLVAVLIMALIGPFGAIPRCVTLAYSTLQLFTPDLPFIAYSAVACILIFILTYSQKRLLEILGYVLTPLLIGSLIVIVVKGLLTGPSAPAADHDPVYVFLMGLVEGYNTMDLLGAFFFSSVVLVCLEQELDVHAMSDKKRLIAMTLKASCIGAGLLGLVYAGFSILSSLYAIELANTPKDVLLGAIAMKVLGAQAGIVACTAVVLACLTTAIALAAVFSQFLQNDIFRGKVDYPICLGLTIFITFLMSTLRFGGISQVLEPVLTVIYPALIVLTVVNLAYKLWNFQPVKTPVLLVLALSLAAYLWPF